MKIEEICLFSQILFVKNMEVKGKEDVLYTRPHIAYCPTCDGSRKGCGNYIPIYEGETVRVK